VLILGRLGYSKKGYSTGEIGAEWIKHFHEQTKRKARGRYRLLLVDGHNSHFTYEFLVFARSKRIIVLCYPSHMTHVLQGLDVVVFSPLKTVLAKLRDRFERQTGKAVAKENFLALLGQAWITVMSPELIKTAFRKTGVVPFNPDAIKPEVLAPSLAWTTAAAMPFEQPTPVRVMAKALSALRRPREGSSSEEGFWDGDEVEVEIEVAARRAYAGLVGGSAGFLASPEPILSASQLPTLHIRPSSPTPTRSPASQVLASPLMVPSADRHLAALEARVQALEAENGDLRHRNRAIQAQMVLQGMYCEQTRSQLHGKEEAAREKKKGNERITTTDSALLTGFSFTEKVALQKRMRQTDDADKMERKEKIGTYREKLASWSTANAARLKRNAAIRGLYQDAKAKWDAEVVQARNESRKPRGKRPTLSDFGRIEKPTARPVHPYPKRRKTMAVVAEPVDTASNDEDGGEPAVVVGRARDDMDESSEGEDASGNESDSSGEEEVSGGEDEGEEHQ
jgi:hypothetical protein